MKLKYIEIQTVSYCNAKCIVCPWSNLKSKTKLKIMPDTIWNNVLENIVELKPDNVILYMNNEPLLDKFLINRIDDIQSVHSHAKIEISTNGMLLKKDICSKLLERNVDSILISLFGCDLASNELLMGKGINYNIVKNNIIMLNNLKQSLKSDSNISVVKLANIPFVDDAKIMDDINYWKARNINTLIYNYVNRSGNIGVSHERDSSIEARGCDFNRHNERTYICADGSVLFCCHDWNKEYVLGNISSNSLKKILESTNYTTIRGKVDGLYESSKDFLCKKCFHCKI